MASRTMEFVSVSTVTRGIGVEDRRLFLLINMASLASGTNPGRKWVSHGGLEAAVAMNIALVMTISADKPRSDVHVHVAGSFTELEGECFARMALHAGVHIFGLLLGKLHSRSILYSMAPITTLHVASLAVQVVIWNVGYAHESVWFLVPVTHAIASKVQALVEEGPQTGTFRLVCPAFRTHH